MKIRKIRWCAILVVGLAIAWTTPQVIGGELAVAANPDEVHDRIDELIRQFRVEEARQLIDDVLSERLHDHRAQLARKALANAYLRMGRKKEADVQFEKLADYMLSNPKQSRPLLKHLTQILVNISSVRQNIEPQASRLLDKAIEVLGQAILEDPNNVAWSGGLTTAISLKARGLQQRAQLAELQALYDRELERLRVRWREQPENPDAWFRLIALLKVASSPVEPGYQQHAAELTVEMSNLLELAAERFSESDALIQEYFSWRQHEAAEIEEFSPETSRSLLSATKRELDEYARGRGSAGTVLKTRIQIEKQLERLNRELTRRKLIGRKPAGLGETEWLTGADFDLNLDQGPLTVLTFFSVRNDQSIMGLIQLNDMLGRIHPQARLIALTHEFEQPFDQLYEAQRRASAADQANRQLYREKMKQQIIDANGFKFPIGISRNSSGTAAIFGISELPYTLLIDETGVCRQILEGPFQPDRFARAIEALHKVQTDGR